MQAFHKSIGETDYVDDKLNGLIIDNIQQLRVAKLFYKQSEELELFVCAFY